MVVQLRRRNFITFAMASIAINDISLAASEYIYIDTTGIKNVSVLIERMRSAAGNRLPKSLKIQEFYKSIAKAAFDNAHRASELNIKVPKLILDSLPKLRVNWSVVPVQAPIFVLVSLMGINFAVPIATFYSIIIGSIWLLMLFLEAEQKKRCPTCRKEEPPEPKSGPSNFIDDDQALDILFS